MLRKSGVSLLVLALTTFGGLPILAQAQQTPAPPPPVSATPEEDVPPVVDESAADDATAPVDESAADDAASAEDEPMDEEAPAGAAPKDTE